MQKNNIIMRKWGVVLVLFLVTFVGLAVFGQPKDDNKPAIKITSVPTDPPGENMASETIKGTVSGGNFKDLKVVIYAQGGPTWWVQPYAASPLTDIGDDGQWESQTHGGTDFAALLVKASYEAKATLPSIPHIGEDVLGVAKKKPAKPSEPKP